MEKCCVICLENNDRMIEYNHCGKYYIHSSCLNKWNINDCFICREKIVHDNLDIVEVNNIIIEDDIPRTRHNRFIRCILWLC